jgi:hypothetical protein
MLEIYVRVELCRHKKCTQIYFLKIVFHTLSGSFFQPSLRVVLSCSRCPCTHYLPERFWVFKLLLTCLPLPTLTPPVHISEMWGRPISLLCIAHIGLHSPSMRCPGILVESHKSSASLNYGSPLFPCIVCFRLRLSFHRWHQSHHLTGEREKAFLTEM